MPMITINDEIVNAASGDNLLGLARRSASHIWFVCDGRGLCQTCECRVLSGAGNLTPPSKIELDTMSESRRGKGYRLACQTRVAGDGPVSVISVAEELRRQATDLLTGLGEDAWTECAGRLADGVARFALDFTRSFPYVALNALPQVVSAPPDLAGIGRYLRDARRVMERVLRDTRSIKGAPAK